MGGVDGRPLTMSPVGEGYGRDQGFPVGGFGSLGETRVEVKFCLNQRSNRYLDLIIKRICRHKQICEGELQER